MSTYYREFLRWVSRQPQLDAPAAVEARYAEQISQTQAVLDSAANGKDPKLAEEADADITRILTSRNAHRKAMVDLYYEWLDRGKPTE
jgi:hypothetical protein